MVLNCMTSSISSFVSNNQLGFTLFCVLFLCSAENGGEKISDFHKNCWENPVLITEDVIGDQPWVLQHDQETKRESHLWRKSPEFSTSKQTWLKIKHQNHVICSSYIEEINHYKHLSSGANKCLWWCIQWKRPNSWPDKWMLYHDYVLSHTALLQCEIWPPLPFSIPIILHYNSAVW